jgi:hypothetical protein
MKTVATNITTQKLQMSFSSAGNIYSSGHSGNLIRKQTWLILSVFLIIVATRLALPDTVFGQVTNTESFNTTPFLPANWAYVGAASNWSRQTAGTFPTITPNSGAGMARFDSYNAALGTTEIMSTPVIDWSGRGSNTPTFSFYLYRYSGSGGGNFDPAFDSVGVYVNTSRSLTNAKFLCYVPRYRGTGTKSGTGVTLTGTSQPAANGWNQYTVTIPANFNTNTNYIMLKGYSGYGYRVFIDDVVWISYPCATTAPGVPPAPVAYCQDATASPLEATGTNLMWYTLASGGTGSATAPTPLTTTPGTTSHWVSQTVGCEGPRARIDVFVDSKPVTSVTGKTNISCNDAKDGTITVSVT